MPYDGMSLHKISSKCGIFAETDANTLLKGGVPVNEIIASLFEAVVYQNLATLTKGNTPMPKVLLLGGPNLFFQGLQQAWRHHLAKLWTERNVRLPAGVEPADCIKVPDDALYYAALGCIEVGKDEADGVGVYARHRAARLVDQRRSASGEGERGRAELSSAAKPICANSCGRYAKGQGDGSSAAALAHRARGWPVRYLSAAISAAPPPRPSCSRPRRNCSTRAYVQSKGNPIEDAKALFRDIRAGGVGQVAALALTGYGKDLLKDIIGADLGVVETVAHAKSALHVFPDADVICDVGGTDVKIMILRQGTVADFRLNSQCSSGNGAFLQGVAERYGIPLEEYAVRAFEAKAMPSLAMGCGVFLQSDIVNQQRKGWSAEEIMAGLASVLPLNVWIYAGQLQNLRAAGRRFVLQGGTHRNLAVVKAQVDFITSKVPDAEIADPSLFRRGRRHRRGAMRARSLRSWQRPSRFRGFDEIEALEYRSTTSADTICRWCPVNCKRAFIDVLVPGAKGRAVEQGSPRGRLGARHQRQFLPQGIAGGRQRDEGGEGADGGASACLSKHWRDGSNAGLPSSLRRSVGRSLRRAASIRIGIPKVLNVWTTHQFWLGFFGALGIPNNRVVFSSDTSESQMREYGRGRGTVDCCYPVKCISGHYGELVFGQKRKIDILFSPMIYSLNSFLHGHVVDSRPARA